MEEVSKELLYGRCKCEGYRGRLYVYLDDKNIIFKKKKYIFFGEMLLVDSIAIRDIKTTKSRILARQLDRVVEIITINKNLLIKFRKYETASEFLDNVLAIKEKDTFINRSLEKLKNIDAKAVLGVVGGVATAAGVAANMSKNPKIKAIGKAASEVGKGISNMAKK